MKMMLKSVVLFSFALGFSVVSAADRSAGAVVVAGETCKHFFDIQALTLEHMALDQIPTWLAFFEESINASVARIKETAVGATDITQSIERLYGSFEVDFVNKIQEKSVAIVWNVRVSDAQRAELLRLVSALMEKLRKDLNAWISSISGSKIAPVAATALSELVRIKTQTILERVTTLCTVRPEGTGGVLRAGVELMRPTQKGEHLLSLRDVTVAAQPRGVCRRVTDVVKTGVLVATPLVFAAAITWLNAQYGSN